MAASAPNRISQELFDETLRENEEVFELDPDEAVRETVEQLTKQQQTSGAASGDCLSHLCLLHPDSKQGQEDRRKRALFLSWLECLDQCVQTDGTIVINNDDDDDSRAAVVEALTGIRTFCTAKNDHSENKNAALRYSSLLQQHQSMYTLMSFLGVVDLEEQSSSDDSTRRAAILLVETLQTLTCLMTAGVDDISVSFRDMFVAWDRWMNLFKFFSSSRHYNRNVQIELVRLASAACRGCEPNKVQWMRSAGQEGVTLLLDCLEAEQKVVEPLQSQLRTACCRLITILCKFDDFRQHSNGPTVGSAHVHVSEFARAGAVPVLHKILVTTSTNGDSRLTAACLGALRVLAIQDEIVQTMVAVGVLTTATKVLEAEENDAQISAAVLGLLRNLSANDDIKTTLCLGLELSSSSQSSSALPGIVQAMKQHPKHALLQEHGCGTLAAMALRKPRNSVCIVEHAGHALILTAMRQHPSNVLVQRQGALAIRNIVSRSNANDNTSHIKEALLDLGAEQVLREIAGSHQGSVDEAYAALRELGCSVSLLKLNADGSITGKTEMFGDTKPNFRPVFEESRDLNE